MSEMWAGLQDLPLQLRSKTTAAKLSHVVRPCSDPCSVGGTDVRFRVPIADAGHLTN